MKQATSKQACGVCASMCLCLCVCVCVCISRTSKPAHGDDACEPFWDVGLVSQPFYLQLSDTAANVKTAQSPQTSLNLARISASRRPD